MIALAGSVALDLPVSHLDFDSKEDDLQNAIREIEEDTNVTHGAEQRHKRRFSEIAPA